MKKRISFLSIAAAALLAACSGSDHGELVGVSYAPPELWPANVRSHAAIRFDGADALARTNTIRRGGSCKGLVGLGWRRYNAAAAAP